jgi:hypothetical protein
MLLTCDNRRLSRLRPPPPKCQPNSSFLREAPGTRSGRWPKSLTGPPSSSASRRRQIRSELIGATGNTLIAGASPTANSHYQLRRTLWRSTWPILAALINRRRLIDGSQRFPRRIKWRDLNRRPGHRRFGWLCRASGAQRARLRQQRRRYSWMIFDG